MRKYYEDDYDDYEEQQEQEMPVEDEYGCAFCWDKKKDKEIELYFFDRANNLRVSRFCPNCGRKYLEE